MITTHYLETALVQAIENHDTGSALALIESIIRNKSANIATIDVNGESFLSLAIKNRELKVANALFEILTNRHEPVIFSVMMPSKTNLFHEAVKQSYLDFFKKLVAISETKQSGELGYRFWFRPDNQGRSLLHDACELSVDVEILDYLLKLTETKINRVDYSGNTPLHYACQSHSTDKISKLLNAGASLSVCNNANITPLSMCLALDETEVLAIFASLEQNKKQTFYELTRSELLKSSDPKMKNLYLKLSRHMSLREQCTAKRRCCTIPSSLRAALFAAKQSSFSVVMRWHGYLACPAMSFC